MFAAGIVHGSQLAAVQQQEYSITGYAKCGYQQTTGYRRQTTCILKFVLLPFEHL